MALLGNVIWALALGLPLEQTPILHDSFDALPASGAVAGLAAYGSVKIEELRAAQA
jgi:hypothetical protein